MNIAHNVERGRTWFPQRTALVFEGKSYSYLDLDRWVNRVANGFRALGLSQGDRIALFLPNIPEFAVSYLAAQKIGAIAVSVNVLLKADEVTFVLKDSGSAAVVTTATLCEKVVKDDLPDLEHILIAEGEAEDETLLEHLAAQASDEFRALSMDRNDPAAIVYTSGTTGFPKGATLSHGNVISNAFSKVHYCGMQPDDRLLLFLPLFHCFGQNAILNSGLYACATIVLQRAFDPDATLSLVASQKITMFFAVPTIFIVLLAKQVPPAELKPVRYYLSGGGTLPLEISRQWFEKYGTVINEGYGLTETSPFSSYNHELKYKFGSVGTPIENVEMRVVSVEDGSVLPPGNLGEIVIRGPNVMLGYWKRPEETAHAMRNGWFHSGDIGKMDEAGYFYVVDRLKDMINVGGLKVYPAEVENVLYQHPAVAQVAVYGVPDSLMEERVKASIVLKPDSEATEQALVAFCRERIADFKIPGTIDFTDELPKNAPGKVLKRVLRKNSTREDSHE